MAARARERRRVEAAGRRLEADPFAEWRLPDDPDDILPQILAARCLGLSYGDPGPVLPPEWCRPCWGERHVWYGNAWGLQHQGVDLFECEHSCHEGEVLLG